ncbi:MAG: hypothetical protein WAS49_05790 [Candidatus Dechloromonas phosphoritropha]|nr:hypothetical protein [Azonexus sp.]
MQSATIAAYSPARVNRRAARRVASACFAFLKFACFSRSTAARQELSVGSAQPVILVVFQLGKVVAYAKNDHLGFQIYYLWNGSRRRFVPDFLIRLSNGKTLVLEIKGEDSDQNKAKRAALEAWVKAINARSGFGVWRWDVALEPAEIQDIVIKHMNSIT